MSADTEWKPIASAPLDGTLVRLRSPKYGEHRMSWAKKEKRWEATVFLPMRPAKVWWDLAFEQPTEWAPIP